MTVGTIFLVGVGVSLLVGVYITLLVVAVRTDSGRRRE
jgi:hypothetical protein